MGGHVVRIVKASPDLSLVGAVDQSRHESIGQDAGEYHGFRSAGVTVQHTLSGRDPGGVIIDFSLAGGTAAAALWAQKNNWNLVSGTTAQSPEDFEALTLAERSVAVLTAPNFSLGIQLVQQFAEIASRILPEDFEVTIVESHHRAKRDRPSGTAKSLEKTVMNTSPCARPIDVSSLRAGSIIGEHELRFISPYEDILISHKALSRSLFAQGAVRCVRWIHQRVPGRYAMKDVLGL
jgi:4-hydroxy-tetrahydrodipicolinate reductase